MHRATLRERNHTVLYTYIRSERTTTLTLSPHNARDKYYTSHILPFTMRFQRAAEDQVCREQSLLCPIHMLQQLEQLT